MQSVKHSKPHSQAFELKGSLLTIPILHLLKNDMQAFIEQLTKNIDKTPNLFRNMPIVIDLQQLNQEDQLIDFIQINNQLRAAGLIPLAVRNGNDSQHLAAKSANLGILSKSQDTKPVKTKSPAPEKPVLSTQVITKPVRSGQQVYARNANLVIINMVSHGAELLADGDIHIYNSLRGRALAGMSGNKEARIFCYKLEAELVSIAGYYKLQEHFPAIPAGHGAQVYLADEQIVIEPITFNTDIS